MGHGDREGVRSVHLGRQVFRSKVENHSKGFFNRHHGYARGRWTSKKEGKDERIYYSMSVACNRPIERLQRDGAVLGALGRCSRVRVGQRDYCPITANSFVPSRCFIITTERSR